MNPLYDRLPETVELCGREYPIVTDFRDWLRFYDMLRDSEGSTEEKMDVLLSFYTRKIPLVYYPICHKPLIKFFKAAELFQQKKEESGNDDAGPTEKPKQLYDFAFDAPFIVSGFRQDYGIDLLDQDLSMHWWKFRLLLMGLSERTEFKQRVMYRNTNTAEIKNVKERQRIQRIQRQIAIPMPAPTDEETGDLFW